MRFIDVFREGDGLVVWLLDSGRNRFLPVAFSPTVLVHAAYPRLLGLRRELSRHGLPSTFETKRTLQGEKRMLSVPTTVKGQRSLVRDIKRFLHHRCELYDTTVSPEDMWMHRHDLFPNAEVECEVEHGWLTSITPVDSPTDEYSIPGLRVSTLSLTTDRPLQADEHPRLEEIRFNDETINGADMAKTFLQRFKEADPDILVTPHGSIELPFLLPILHKAEPDFSFSRFGTDRLMRKGGSYFSYGRTIFKNATVALRGRLHLERKGVLYGDWNLLHPFELARVCRSRLQVINHRSVGYGVTSLQTYYALRRGYAFPSTVSCMERWTSAEQLFNADRGSFIYDPIVGYHENIAEIDFVSLFPSIMVKHNISTETLFCRCCPRNRVPGMRMNVCTKERGIIPELLEPLVAQRIRYKESGTSQHLERANALKGVLVTSFGYMGFRKSLFSRIEAHQAIQAYARETLLAASRIAESHGFAVMHGITDSIWVKKEGLTEQDTQRVIDDIESRIGLPAKLEGIYRWIVFLPSTQDRETPVPTRYYGVFLDGELKCRGIEVRRHDTPPLLVELQLTIIKEISTAGSEEEFLTLMRCSIRHLKQTIARIREGLVSQDELIITQGISKTEYASHIAQGVVADKLQSQGLAPQPGQYVRYVITNKNAAIPIHRYSLPTSSDCFPFDRAEYMRLARRAVQNLFLPFVDGVTEEQLTLADALQRRVAVEGLPLQIVESVRQLF
ncbi:MAG: DNA polymerase domain-containing protein [archaeon]